MAEKILGTRLTESLLTIRKGEALFFETEGPDKEVDVRVLSTTANRLGLSCVRTDKHSTIYCVTKRQ